MQEDSEEIEDGVPAQEDSSEAMSEKPKDPSPRELAVSEIDQEIDINLDDAPSVSQLPFSFVTRHDKKTVQLLSNSGRLGGIAGKRIWFKYEFSETCFIEQIVVIVDDYSSYTDFEVSYTTFDGRKYEEKVSPQQGRLQRSINQFVKEISFRPPRRPGFHTKVEKVILYGFPQSHTAKFGNYADSLDEKRDEVLGLLSAKEAVVLDKLEELISLEAQKSEIADLISEGKETLVDQANELGKIRSRREEVVTRIESLKQSVRENEQTISDQKNKIGEISDIRSELARSIIAKQQKLKELTSNINLFPSELSDFVSQGARDVKLYALLAAFPIAVIAIMFGILIEGGADLTTKITGETNINILAILISRMPFVIVAITVITACYYLARMFILEMVRVNRQKLSLSKIGIVAKDISYSIENELDLEEEDKYSRRLRLKMDMLRDHLKEYLSKDFEPSLPKRSPFEQISLPGFRKKRSGIEDDPKSLDGHHELVDDGGEDEPEENRLDG